MAQFLNLELAILAYNSNSISNYPADAIQIDNTTISGYTVSDISRQILVLPSAGSYQSISLPSNPASMLVIFSDQNLTYQINGIATDQALTLALPGIKTPIFLYSGNITSLLLKTPASVSANVDIWLITM